MHELQEGNHKCTKCGEVKNHSKFYKDGRKVSGVSSWCKDCSLKVARVAIDRRKKAKEDKISQMHQMPQKENGNKVSV